MEPQTILFFGRPGAGKSTQFRMLAEYLERTSDKPVLAFRWSPLIRSFMKGDSFAQRHARELVDSGELLPLFLAPSIWLPELLNRFTGEEHLLIDGLPRHMVEAELLTSAIEFYDRTSVAILNLEISSDAAQARLVERGKLEHSKKDLSIETIQKRLGWFEKELLPIRDFLSGQPGYNLHSIDGNVDSDEVHEAIKNSIGI